MTKSNLKNIFTSRFNLKILFLILTIVGYIPYISLYFDSITELFMVILFFVALYDLYKQRKRILKDKIALLLLLSVPLYSITIVINGIYFNDIKILLYIFIFIWFICLDYNENDDYKIEFQKLAIIMSIVTFLIAIISLILYYSSITITYVVDMYNIKYLGIFNNSLYGVLGNANVMCFFAFIGLFFSIYLFRNNKLFYGLNVFLQIVCIILTNSRGGLLGLLFSAAVFSFLYLKMVKYKKCWKSILASALCCLIVFISSFAVDKIDIAVHTALYNSTIQTVSPEEVVVEEDLNEDGHDDLTFDRSEGEMQDNTNRRLDMYIAGLKCFIDHPLLGVGREKTAQLLCDLYLDKDSPMNSIGLAGNMHNTYIQTLAGAGILGFLTVFGFVAIIIWKLFKKLLKENKNENAMFIICSLTYICYVLFSNLFESEMYLSRSITAFCFWLVIGLIFRYLKSEEGNHDD